ncbi:glycosyltransferase [Paenibacillus sp. J2TS4]|uniref:glycosyltransferase n=1 Tax=Paenibacillus sp. J2TS4 TaxID=2807194 RepID=UPI001AFEAC62|nr:glycosyltransferase [Paenibacillus sp. J2TS4]GIP35028.1 putative glycosyltransferase EpsF [Paenibacillus sp. J2TS4]
MVNNKINILHIFGKMNRGGAELRTIDLLHQIDHDAYTFYFCSLSGQRGELDDVITSLGGKMTYCKFKSFLFPFKFIKLLKKNHIHVVHSNTFYFSGMILMLAKLAGVKVRIAHFRTTDSGKQGGSFQQFKYTVLKNLIQRYATNIIGVSKSSLVSSMGKEIINDKRTEVIYNGIDLNKINHPVDLANTLRSQYKLDEESKIIIHIGRLVEAKNHLKLINVFKEMTKRSSCYLFLVGKENEPTASLIKTKTEEYAISDRVFFLGVQSNVFELLKQADLMIYPSIREGLPGAVLEALACGVPVLGSQIDPIVELSGFFDNLACLPLAAEDRDWADFAVGMIQEAESQNFKKQAYAQFRQTGFTSDQFAKSYLEILQKAL